ncbi:NADP-dependent oxidoreductase [Neolewinella persica]|uniref:NADP-dependent oxidoreductase n=1 Tax=Neolewinella persica TaxID=70998 RepID=UPI000376023D|nr:NADP-dependent oxidoreductase [Neolewinella persica]
MTNRQQILAHRPVGMPTKDTWTLTETEVPELKDGEVLIRNQYVSLDPAMRGWMNDARSYIPPVQLGEVMRAGTVGEVIKANNHPTFKVGDVLSGWGGVQEYSITDGTNYYQVDTRLAPMPTYIGTLGMPGMTAYFGILEVGKIKEGDVVVVSGAAGAVGSIVGQIAKIKGCHVVGIAGGPDKCKYVVEELGFDACIDYKNESVAAGLKTHCPKGMDVYFDNVGGEILDHCLARLKMNARIVICGAISQYNNRENVQGPKNYLSLLVNRATMQGMVVFDYAPKYGEAALQMGQWMAAGKLKSREDIYEGIENFYETFTRLFTGEKKGKLVLKLV